MIIGHAPAGYLISSRLHRHFPEIGRRAFLAAGMLGAIAPDIDMLYFYLIDNRQHHHHTYFTHWPVVWLALLALSVLWLKSRRSAMAALATIFSLNGMVHMVLDTTVGEIWWLAPYLDRAFAFFTVPALYKPWWWNFILHWSFGLEILVCFVALYAWRRTRNSHVRN